MSQLLRVLCASAAGCGVLTASTAGASVSLEVKAYTGVPAPGAAPGKILEFVQSPVVNDAGEVAFVGHIRDTLSDVWGTAMFGPGANGQPTWIASTFEPVPDLSPERYFHFGSGSDPRLGDDGTIVFSARLSGPGIIEYPEDTTEIWRWNASSALAPVAREGHPVPEAGPGAVLGPLYGAYSSPIVGHDGTIGFVALAAGTGDPYSPFVFVDVTDGQTTRFVPQGTPIPGLPGATVAFYGEAFANEHGAWMFNAAIEGPDVVPGQNDIATFTWDPQSGLAMRIRAGDPAPGTPPGVVFWYWNWPYPNAAGDFAYSAWLSGPGVSEDDDTALYGPSASGGLALIAREGHPAPGTEPGSVFESFGSFGVVINAGGEVVFAAELSGPSITPDNAWGLWRHRPATGAVELLARSGDPAPELPGVTLAGAWPLLNDRGDVVYLASLAGAGVTPETDLAIFALPAGATAAEKVLRESDLVPFGPGDLRPLTDLLLQGGFPSDVPGLATFSNEGHLVFKGRTPGVIDVVVVATIPEPGFASGLAAGLALLAALARTRSRR